jgi:hypothetical protein
MEPRLKLNLPHDVAALTRHGGKLAPG